MYGKRFGSKIVLANKKGDRVGADQSTETGSGE